MTILTFSEPVFLKDHFDMPADTTPWPKAGTSAAYVKTSPGKTPARDRAPFKTQTRGMEPKSGYGKCLSKTYGLYVLAFGGEQDLTPYIYVGTAVGESVLDRIRKHRVKATGSHIGRTADVYGSVDHTTGWRPFAEQRHIEHAGRPDQCADVRLMVGSLPIVDETQLCRFESSICRDKTPDGVLNQIKALLWPDTQGAKLLTKRSRTALASGGMSIMFWNGQTKVFP